MKVLFISTEDARYGAPKSMQKLMELLMKEHNVECVLLTKKHNILNDWCDEKGIENYSCNYRDIMAGDSYERWYLNFAKHCVKRLRYIKGGLTQKKIDKLGIDFDSIDLIHSNTNRVDIGVYISKKYNIPHIWHLREMDEGTKNMHYYKKNWADYMNRGTDAFVAITNVVKDSWISKGLDENKIKVIYNGIDPQGVVSKEKENFQDDIIKIVAVGRVERAKGQMDLINALCRLDEVTQQKFQVDFIGESYSDYKKMLMQKMEQSKCQTKINYCGYCGNVGEVLQQYDIGITCSPAEAFGRTTIEYMMAGLLTIASKSGANQELIDDEDSGIIYDNDLADSLERVLINITNNREKYIKIAQNGRLQSIKRFNAEMNANLIYELYTTILLNK